LVRISYLILAFCAAAVASTGFTLGQREAELARLGTMSDLQSFELLRSSTPARAMSVRGDRAILYACDDAMSGRVGTVMPPSALVDIAGKCLGIARSIRNAVPGWAFPRYVIATAAYILNDKQTTREELALSQELGPHEGWLAERRVALALRVRTNGNDPIEPPLDADLRALFASSEGRKFLARQFIVRTDLRDWISANLGDMDNPSKADFIQHVRRQAQPTGQGDG
jgi:hypothetical protein